MIFYWLVLFGPIFEEIGAESERTYLGDSVRLSHIVEEYVKLGFIKTCYSEMLRKLAKNKMSDQGTQTQITLHKIRKHERPFDKVKYPLSKNKRIEISERSKQRRRKSIREC